MYYILIRAGKDGILLPFTTDMMEQLVSAKQVEVKASYEGAIENVSLKHDALAFQVIRKPDEL